MRVDDYETKTGNDIYEGFAIDLIKAISEILNFKYNIKMVEDGTYGARRENGEWGGMIRELMDGKADIAVADLTITYERESAVDFTMPFMNLGESRKLFDFNLIYFFHRQKRYRNPIPEAEKRTAETVQFHVTFGH